MTESQWDAYLERIEDLVYNLVEGEDEEQTELEIRNYEHQNRIKINQNQGKLEDLRRKEFARMRDADDTLNS